MSRFKNILATVALALTCTFPRAAEHDIGEVVAAILPTPLVAEYTCGLYAGAVMRPAFVARWSDKVKESTAPQEVMRDALTEYARLMRSFCGDIQEAFKGKDAAVTQAYATHYPGYRGDLNVLENREVMSWLQKENVLLRRAVILRETYEIAKRLAPELIAPRGAIRLKDDEFRLVQTISIGGAAESERTELITLLRDEDFRRVAPKEFNLDAWRAEEQLSRDTSRRFDWRLTGFNENASDLTRHSAQGFGLDAIVERHKAFFVPPPPPRPAPSSYQESIRSIGATQDWRRIYFFGEQYDYVLTPTKDLLALLDSSYLRRFRADLRDLRLNGDNTVSGRLMAVVKESAMPPEDLEKYQGKHESFAGYRVLYARTLMLRRYHKTEISLAKVGLPRDDNSYYIRVIGTAPQPETQVVSEKSFKTGPVALKPLFFLWYAPDENRPPEPPDVNFSGVARTAPAASTPK